MQLWHAGRTAATKREESPKFPKFFLCARHSIVCKHNHTNLFSNSVLYLYFGPKSELYFAVHEKASQVRW